jgi:hypothetical protein
VRAGQGWGAAVTCDEAPGRTVFCQDRHLFRELRCLLIVPLRCLLRPPFRSYPRRRLTSTAKRRPARAPLSSTVTYRTAIVTPAKANDLPGP